MRVYTSPIERKTLLQTLRSLLQLRFLDEASAD
jgi:hypothetical protein